MPAKGFFSMGVETYQVSVAEVFVANRRKLVEKLQDHLREEELSHHEVGDNSGGGWIYLEGGASTTRFDSDHEPIFRQESYFWYLTGVKEPDCAVGIQVETGHTCLFVPRWSADYATVMGPIPDLEEWQHIYQVDEVRYTDQADSTLQEWLGIDLDQRGLDDPRLASSISPRRRLFLLRGLNTDSNQYYDPPSWLQDIAWSLARIDRETLFPILAECRVHKSPAELALLQHVTRVTSGAHAYVMRHLKPNMMEYQAESLFRYYCSYQYGCRLVGYTAICGCGPRAAILHYGHAGRPNDRAIRPGDLCLMDMGAEYFGYGSDVTCTFPISGKFSEAQRAIYQAVLNAQVAVYNLIRPGVSWVDCHVAAETEILQALIELGIVLLPADQTVHDLAQCRLGAVFMPHGLGHLIGIDTHDVGGYLPGHPPRIEQPGLRKLRTARILQENMTLTVEPGCYFIDHLLDEALSESSPGHAYLNGDRLAEFRGTGGVRLEDVVVVTRTGCRNYTTCPRTVAEVEGVMAGQPWPPVVDTAPELRRVALTTTSSASSSSSSSFLPSL